MKKLILIGLLAAAFTNCEDATDIVQPSEFNFGVAFQNAQDVKTGIFNVYASANVTTGISFTSNFTDEASLGEAGNAGSPALRLQLNVSDGFANALWANYLSAVRNANILFEGAAGVTPTEMEDIATYNEALGEAHALRAYAYSQLLAYFSEDLSDGSSLAVPVFDFVPGFDFAPQRNTVDEVVAFINSDLDEAERLLNSAGTDYNEIFVSLEYVSALRARVAAYIGDYGSASTAANNVLNSLSLPAVANESAFRAVWEDENDSSEEVIFKYDNTLAVGSSIGQIWNTNSSSVAGSPLLEVGRNLFEMYEERSNNFGDIRRDVFIDASSIISDDYANEADPRNADIIVIDKYPGNVNISGLVGGYTNDQKVFRTVEMHFILAEAAVASGNLSEAGNQLKIIRDARYTSQQPAPTFSNATEAWDAILTERKLELAYEGHRYIDVKRLGALANQSYDRDETDCSLYQGGECDLSFNDFRARSLPIPQSEFRGNPGIQQNPGY